MNFPIERYDWTRLSPLQVGRYAEYFVKMEFVLYGFEIYTTEIDDHGVDFVVRKQQSRYYDVQVKSIRFSTTNGYVFFPKDKFVLESNLLAVIVLLQQHKPPQLFLIPAREWLTPTALLVSHDYEGLKSKPEWGLNISIKNLPLLEQYSFEKVLGTLEATGD